MRVEWSGRLSRFTDLLGMEAHCSIRLTALLRVTLYTRKPWVEGTAYCDLLTTPFEGVVLMAVQVGQILEIETSRGLAYVQYVSRHTKYGDTIRVLPGLFKARPPEFSELAREQGYFTFY